MSLLAYHKLAVMSEQHSLIVVNWHSANSLMNSNHLLEFLRVEAMLEDSPENPESALDAVITFSLARQDLQWLWLCRCLKLCLKLLFLVLQLVCKLRVLSWCILLQKLHVASVLGVCILLE